MGDEQMTQEQKGKTPVLDVQNLTKIYDNGGKGDGNEVLKNVNFTMNEGEFVCILGPSGCGKTTFLRCIGGFETFDGTVKVNGKEVTEPGTDRIMVFQDFNQLLPWKTVEKNVQYPLKIQGLKDKTKLGDFDNLIKEKNNLVEYIRKLDNKKDINIDKESQNIKNKLLDFFFIISAIKL